ncbi:hypothetical protein BX616_001160, partial [Lobosporangium transversale]|uniref:Uncharacterized protein n=1 Tax=Lobosporangium transversale TaxID=64571 RepID=A0A1Y2H3W7_9FUNG|eukprot:XP_021886088.1 hypothetical protein BCR41DRAFT_73430 [Lobosporangium transversale]
MFMLSWIRSDAQASNASNAAVEVDASDVVTASATTHSDLSVEKHQDDWVFLPSNHNDLMESSVSDLDLLSASMTLYRPGPSTTSKGHPASARRTQAEAETISASTTETSTSERALTAATSTAMGVSETTPTVKKSKRQLKQERRQQQALEELERQPRYDPITAKKRDQEFKMAKLAKMSMRSKA